MPHPIGTRGVGGREGRHDQTGAASGRDASDEGDANKGRATTDRSGASGMDKPHRNGAAQTGGESDDRPRRCEQGERFATDRGDAS